MEFGYRTQVIGLATSAVLFAAYWALIIIRAASDGLPFTEVAWQWPLLWVIILGGSVYAIVFAVSRYRLRGQVVEDERDTQIALHASSLGGGLTGVVTLAVLVMLALDADTFWVAHVLFVGSWLGSVAEAGTAIAGYREGIEA